MKRTGIVFFISLLCGGCFTGSSITNGELAPDDRMVCFTLQDGSYIKSYSGNHHRICVGYHIIGEIMRTHQSPQRYEGIVGDADIVEIKVDKFNTVGTLLGCVIGGLVIAYPIGTGEISLWD